MNIRQICEASGISASPSYYSGRGPTTSDLNEAILSKIHALIQREHGGDAAAAFVKLVAALPVPSASAFLNALFALEENNWVFIPEQAQASNICPDNIGSAFATVENVLSRAAGGRDAERIAQQRGAQVRGAFLMRHMPRHRDAKRMYGDY